MVGGDGPAATHGCVYCVHDGPMLGAPFAMMGPRLGHSMGHDGPKLGPSTGYERAQALAPHRP
jgi:hypothetical protein